MNKYCAFFLNLFFAFAGMMSRSLILIMMYPMKFNVKGLNMQSSSK